MCQICLKWAGKAPAEGRPNLARPSPNVRRDKISRLGEPLTLINGTTMARHGLILGQHGATVITVLLNMSLFTFPLFLIEF